MASYIGNKLQAGEFKKLDSIESSFDGSTTTFNLSFNGTSVIVGDVTNITVSLNGVVQEPGEAYTLATGGSQIVFSSAPASGSDCFITQIGSVGGTATPSDDSVTTTKIVDNAVTSGKLHTAVTADIDSKAPINNPSFTGEYVGIPTITTAQRDALTPQNGYLIYNTTINLMQQYADSRWQSIAAPPILTALSYPDSQTAVNPDGGDIITLSGANFEVGVNVKFGNTYATSVTRTNSTSLTVTTPAVSAGTYDVVVENPSGLTASLTDGITFNANPVFSTAAGNIGTITQDVAMSTITIVATEDDSGTLSYSITTGALPTGLSLSSANGEITGTPSGYSGDTTVNFTVTATDDENQTTERQFNLIVLVKFYTYELSNSLTFNDDDGSHLTRTPSSAGDRRTWTWSGWVKRANPVDPRIFSVGTGTDKTEIAFGDSFVFRYRTSSNNYYVQASAKFRDPGAWYHVVVAIDTTQATDSNRVKLYINGERITDFSNEAYPPQNEDMGINSITQHNIGYLDSASTTFFDGYMAEVNFIDGTALDPTSFGKFTQDIWIPQEYTGTYGTNGFYLDFSNDSDLGNDSSGNNNDWSIGNAAQSTTVEDLGPSSRSLTLKSDTAYSTSYALTGYVGSIYVNGTGNANSDSGSPIDLTNDGALSPNGSSNNITFEAWVYNPGSVDGGVLWHAHVHDYYVPNFGINSDGSIYYMNQSNGGSNYYRVDSSPGDITANTWHHIAVTIDSSKTVKLYVDGNYKNQRTWTTGTWGLITNGKLQIAQGWTGYINQIRISSNIRYSGNFTPTTGGFTSDGNTSLLIQPGISTVSLDSSNHSIDNPTNKFATFNPLTTENGSLSEGNLKWTTTGNWLDGFSTIALPSSGKWYAEFKPTINGNQSLFGLRSSTTGQSTYMGWYSGGTTINASSIGGYSSGDKLSLAVDVDNGTVKVYKNGTLSVTDTGKTVDNLSFYVHGWDGSWYLNCGQDSSFAGTETAQGNTDGNGIGDFYYTPPSGYLALCTANLSETGFGDILERKPSDHFNTVLWTGNGTSQNVTGVGFEPDFVWVKERSSTSAHALHDIVRGITKRLQTNGDNAEVIPSTGGITAVNSDGFSVGADGAYNQNSQTYVAWCWKAGGTPVSNTNGSITSSVSANTTAGFSIVGYTGNDTAGATIGHGLSSAPDMMIVKKRSANPAAENWTVYHTSLGATKGTYLNLTATPYTLDIYWNDTAPTSSVFSIGQWDGINTSGEPYIAYCWHSVLGFSKFGSYTGNGSTDGPFVYTGFKPAFIMVKHTDGAHNWQILDNARDVDNPVTTHIHPNLTNAEANAGSAGWYDSLSNGFKVRATYNEMNISGSNYIYMAFAEDPFKYGNSR